MMVLIVVVDEGSWCCDLGTSAVRSREMSPAKADDKARSQQ